MADLLDTLGQGALTVGKTALAVPQAIGGGALDILIGDRTNVPVGEQVKRSIEALLLAGDNPGNLVGIHAMNAKRDAANQAIVGSPDFQDFLRRAQDHGAAPMEAYTAAAKLYGVHGYAPTTGTAQVPDLSVGPPTMGPQQETRPLTVPILPPPAATDVIKHVDALTALDALSRIGPEGEAARAAHADVPLPMGIPQALADETLKRLRQSEAFLTHETGVKIDGRGNVILDYQERKLPLFPEGVSRVNGYDRFREVPTPYPGIVTVEPDPAVDARARVRAELEGRNLRPGTPGVSGTAGVSAAPVTVTAPGAAPLQTPVLSLTPEMSGAEMELAGATAAKNLQLAYDKERAAQEIQLKGVTLNEDDRKRLNQIATARAFLNTFENYATNGTANDTTALPIDRFPSSLPKTRISGPNAVVERARQSQIFQDTWQRDPFLRNYRGYQGLAKPILTRSIGGDVGNLAEQEQQAVEDVIGAITLPEVRDSVRQLRAIITSREKEVLAGKAAPGVAPTAGRRVPSAAESNLNRAFLR